LVLRESLWEEDEARLLMMGMMRFLIINWVFTGNLLVLFSMFLMASIMVFSKFIVNKKKFSSSWRRHWESSGIVADDRFRNQFFLEWNKAKRGTGNIRGKGWRIDVYFERMLMRRGRGQNMYVFHKF